MKTQPARLNDGVRIIGDHQFSEAENGNMVARPQKLTWVGAGGSQRDGWSQSAKKIQQKSLKKRVSGKSCAPKGLIVTNWNSSRTLNASRQLPKPWICDSFKHFFPSSQRKKHKKGTKFSKRVQINDVHYEALMDFQPFTMRSFLRRGLCLLWILNRDKYASSLVYFFFFFPSPHKCWKLINLLLRWLTTLI